MAGVVKVQPESTRSDKYGRYLADIFYGKDTYLNQRLLDEGHAQLIGF